MEYYYDKLLAAAKSFSAVTGKPMNLKAIEYEDDNGNTYKLLFDKDTESLEETMPEIETGDVLQTYNLGPMLSALLSVTMSFGKME